MIYKIMLIIALFLNGIILLVMTFIQARKNDIALEKEWQEQMRFILEKKYKNKIVRRK